jgi:hypothetical protein
LYKRLVLLTALLVTACAPPLTPLPVAIGTETPTVAVGAASTATLTVPSTASPCYYNWARHRLPDLSEQVQSAIQEIQPEAQAYAEAYGEDCLDQQGNSVRFTAKETDFYLTLLAIDLNDQNELGNLLDQALTALDEFPAEQTPGPQSGYVGITFQAEGGESRLWFRVEEADDFRQSGLHGADLLKALSNNP